MFADSSAEHGIQARETTPRRQRFEKDVERNQIRVLIVDDDPRYTEMLEAAFEVEGILATRIQDPRQAHETAAALQPDVIITDVTMPDVDGFTLAAGLKMDARTAEIPVIFVSAQTRSGNGFPRGYHRGADYLPKPFSVPELIKRIRAAVLAQPKGTER